MTKYKGEVRPSKEDIIGLYQSEKYLSLRYQSVASRLETDPYETLAVMHELADSGFLFRQNGYYRLNPRHLWRK